MSTKLKSEFYFVSPLEVVKVTTENLQQVADWCGGKVATVESRKVKGRIDSYVWVPTPKGTQISWAFPGMFITKRMVVTLKDELKETYSVFRRDYFEKNYFGTPNEAVDATWERHAKQNGTKKETQVTDEELSEQSEGIPTPAHIIEQDQAMLANAKAMLDSIPEDAPPVSNGVPVENIRAEDPPKAKVVPNHLKEVTKA